MVTPTGWGGVRMWTPDGAYEQHFEDFIGASEPFRSDVVPTEPVPDFPIPVAEMTDAQLMVEAIIDHYSATYEASRRRIRAALAYNQRAADVDAEVDRRARLAAR